MQHVRSASIAVAAVAMVTLVITGAQASSLDRPCTAAPESQYLAASDLQARAEAQGYTVQKVKIAKACGEIYALDKTGIKVELFMDPTNGNIIGTK